MQTVEDYCVEWKFLFVFYLNNPFEMRLCPFHNNCVLSEKCTGRKYICCCLFLQPISISVMDSPLHSGGGGHLLSDLFAIFHRFSLAMNLIDLIDVKLLILKLSLLALFFFWPLHTFQITIRFYSSL